MKRVRKKGKERLTVRGTLNKREEKYVYVCACEPAANLGGCGTLPR